MCAMPVLPSRFGRSCKMWRAWRQGHGRTISIAQSRPTRACNPTAFAREIEQSAAQRYEKITKTTRLLAYCWRGFALLFA